MEDFRLVILPILILAFAFTGGLQPGRRAEIVANILSWFSFGVFVYALWRVGLPPSLFIGHLTLLIYIRSMLRIWGTAILSTKIPEKVERDIDASYMMAFGIACIAGFIAIISYIINLIFKLILH